MAFAKETFETPEGLTPEEFKLLGEIMPIDFAKADSNDEKELAEFIQSTGEYGMDLFGQALEECDGDVAEALSEARRAYNRNPSRNPDLEAAQAMPDTPEEAEEGEKAEVHSIKTRNKLNSGKVPPSPFRKE